MVSSIMENKRNSFSLITHHLKKHCQQIEVSTILKAFCAALKNELESQGNASDSEIVSVCDKELPQCCRKVAACSLEVDTSLKIHGVIES